MQQILVRWYEEALKRKSEFLAELYELLRFESVYNQESATENAPFGKEISQALNHMLQLGKQDGFKTKNVAGYAGHIEWGEGTDLIGILAHVDVVSPGNAKWTTPPFEPHIRDGKLYARGALDDKGPLMAAYFALKMIKELQLPISKRVRLIVGTDEETHWRCVKRYFQEEEMPTMGFTPDADFPIIIGEKGLLSLTFAKELDVQPSSDETRWNLKEFRAGHESNKVPDLAKATLQGEGDVFALKEAFQDFLLQHQIQGYAEATDDGVELVLKGIAYHAFRPDCGLNALLYLCQFLQKLPLDEQGASFVSMIDQYFVDSYYGEKLEIAIADDTMGPLTLNLGVADYQSGQGAELNINIRYPRGVTQVELKERMEAKLGAYGFSLVETDHIPLHYVDQHHELVQKLSSVYEAHTGSKAELLTTGGATYARAIDVGVAFGPLFPNQKETAHQQDECIEVNDLVRAIAIYAQAIFELANE